MVMTLQGLSMAIKTKPNKEKRLHTTASYTSKILKAGALIGDTKTLLSHWDATSTVTENIDRIQRENIFGKASRSRVKDILRIFQQRYLTEEPVNKALVTLVRRKFPSAALERLLYFHSARADKLLHDSVTKILIPMLEQGLVDINPNEFQRSLTKWVDEGKMTGHWSEITINRVSRSLLAALRDFGVLQGATNKKIAPAFLPIEAFAYIVFYLKLHQPSGVKLLQLPDWKLFFLSSEGVERFLFEAHQLELLEYHVAGSVTRLTFPAETLQEYANVLAQR
ncbi:hypothetical protein HG66A1_62030 [Gimesia chilikensis]|uniref:DUF1819 family protein n=2 Tax=Planctomycetaceae TaxID=126 RepID=A0A517PYB5_9PLAN|nr:hypothetical protein [Gimesia sp.]QDT24371.1 hypothetical protein HG66A1_62030 [Gimesia chilikensis]|tara:strand:+ start:5894 stop:6736 length:843 start_codon:yes stop_codon:yes gene_type:complete